jgi:hypothetical protein
LCYESPVGSVAKRRALLVVCLSVASAGCGRATLEPEWSWGEADGSVQAAGSGGAGGSGTSGSASFGGMTAGTTFGGAAGVGGSGIAGSAALCPLPIGDCEMGEPGCDGYPACAGETVLAHDYRSPLSAITDITASEREVVVAGYYQGQLDFGGDASALAVANATDAFVAGFVGGSSAAEWAEAVTGAGTQTVSGIDLTSQGALFLQGTWDERVDADPALPLGPAYVARGNAQHVVGAAQLFGSTDSTRPGGVAVDSNGAVFLAGTFTDRLTIGDRELTAVGECGYLAKLTQDGALLWLEPVKPEGFASARVTKVVVDDEGSAIVIGDDDDAGNRGFFRKHAPDGQVSFTKVLTASQRFQLRALAVDRQLRITVGGSFSGFWHSDVVSVQSSSDTSSDAWFAQYSATGSVIWARAYSSRGQGALVSAASIDAFGNIVLAGVAGYLEAPGEAIDPPLHGATSAAFVLKMRSNGAEVWSRGFYGGAQPGLALVTDRRVNIWLGGSFTGSFEVGPEVVSAMDRGDAFLIRLSP